MNQELIKRVMKMAKQEFGIESDNTLLLECLSNTRMTEGKPYLLLSAMINNLMTEQNTEATHG